MLIALDYDDTYTRDPILWDQFIKDANKRGHSVICCTMRFDKEGAEVERDLGHLVERIVYTGRMAKRKYLHSIGYNVHVFIDDTPEFIVFDAKG